MFGTGKEPIGYGPFSMLTTLKGREKEKEKVSRKGLQEKRGEGIREKGKDIRKRKRKEKER